MKLLRANTAVDVLIGPFVDSTDGDTDETGLTIAQADVRLSKNAQNMAQKNDANAATHDELGYYNCPLDTTDTNTEGQLDIIVHESGALHVKGEFMVLAEAAWDSMFVAKDDGFMDVNIKTVGRTDTQETEADNLESACSNYSVTRGLTGTAVPAVAADGVGGLPISDAGGLDLDAILADTNELQGDWTNAGRLDAILDIIAADTTTDIPALIATAQTDLDTITGASGVIIPDGELVAAKFGADCLTAAKVAADVHTEGATAVWASSNSTLTKAYSLIMEQIYQFLHNDMNITDATGAVALRNLANDADMATWGITDNDTTTARTDVVWS